MYKYIWMLVVLLPSANTHWRSSSLKQFRHAWHLALIKGLGWVMILHQQRELVLLIERIVLPPILFASHSACDPLNCFMMISLICVQKEVEWEFGEGEQEDKELHIQGKINSFGNSNLLLLLRNKNKKQWKEPWHASYSHRPLNLLALQFAHLTSGTSDDCPIELTGWTALAWEHCLVLILE
jgi:hypothetical protein